MSAKRNGRAPQQESPQVAEGGGDQLTDFGSNAEMAAQASAERGGDKKTGPIEVSVSSALPSHDGDEFNVTINAGSAKGVSSGDKVDVGGGRRGVVSRIFNDYRSRFILFSDSPPPSKVTVLRGEKWSREKEDSQKGKDDKAGRDAENERFDRNFHHEIGQD